MTSVLPGQDHLIDDIAIDSPSAFAAALTEQTSPTHPQKEIANLYGISDTAVRKKCFAMAIPKPGKGFWNKVQAGKLPHPNGELPAHRKSPQPHTSELETRLGSRC